MSHENPKSQLFEKCARERLPAPVFSTTREPDTVDHMPVFRSRCTFQSKKYTAKGNTKKEAELIVCSKILKRKEKKLVNREYKNNKRRNDSVTSKFNELIQLRNFQEADRIILLDTDNISLNHEQMETTYSTQILAFTAKNTTKTNIFDLERLFPFVHVFISDRVGRDAADFLLAFYAGKLSMLDLDKDIYILTRDHYGEHLETFLDRGKFVCKYEDCFDN